ncbi:RNA pyrophosphohydrolase [Chakrabartia godavariana]|nr:RNA pyrophosphohydrolase [Chakrabartia godavariana]
MSDPYAHLPYRPCAGIMLRNADGLIFVGQRLDNMVEAWQMPQGGIDEGEDPLTAALRELGEEAGIQPHLVELVARSADQHLYDLPDELMGKIWGGKYRGQSQHWFLFNFLGDDSDVDIETAHQEFRAWRWAHPHELIDLIVPFKRELYANVLREFADHL